MIPQSRRSRWLQWTGGGLAAFCVAVLALWALWDWNWFRALAEARLSAAIDRPVTIDRLEVHPGRVVGIVAQGVTIANPPGFEGPEFATANEVRITFELMTWWHTSRVVLPLIEIDQPTFNVVRTATGADNLVAVVPVPGSSPTMEIGDVEITKGAAHVMLAPQKADFTATIETSSGDQLISRGKGTYAGQAVTFNATGGAVLRLASKTTPYPIDFTLVNGETRIALKGHIDDPFALTGADLNLLLSGADMAQLYPILGIATPGTPPYKLSGKLDFANGLIKFTGIEGKVGSSDLSGELDVDPRGARPVLSGTLVSHQVDMADLGGFVGSTPGRASTPGMSTQQVQQLKAAEESPRLLPNRPISVPKVRAADVHLTYRGEKIIGKDIPFNFIDTKMDIDDGHLRLAPLRLGVGGGTLAGTVDLNPIEDQVDSDVDLTLQHVDIGKLLASAHLGTGNGSIDGSVKVKGRGSSLSSILAHGDGRIYAVMPTGGNINSLLVDLLGLELGNAFFAAIGIPNSESIQCAVADLELRQGVLASRVLQVNTTEHVITGGGRVDVANEVLEMTLRTDPKHFTIGALPTPVVISGPFKNLKFGLAPDAAVRGGAAVALGLLFPPAAILPTIQFGVGEGSHCADPVKPPR